MPTPLTIHLTTLFQQDLDAKSDEAIMRMASEWLKVERSLQDEILLLATELASPPGAVKLDPISEMVLTMQRVGYAPGRISQLLAAQGIFKVPGVPQPQAKQISDWQLAQLQRYVRLLAQVQQQLEVFTGQIATPVIDQLRENAALAGIENAVAMIDATISSGAPGVIDLTFDRLNVEAVQNIVAISGAGKPLGNLLQAAYPLTANGITNELVYGTAVGRNPRQTARKIISDGMAQGLNHVLLVARDQQNRAAREGARQQYLKSGIIQQYRRRAAHQARTCLACLALDGKVYDVAELMPLHPQDRCLLPGQFVTTKQGLIVIEDVQIGDEVLTHRGRFKRVIKTSARRYTGQVIKVTYGGKELICTPDHKLLTKNRGWVEAQELLPDDILPDLT